MQLEEVLGELGHAVQPGAGINAALVSLAGSRVATPTKR
jgi:hypothetical protein